MSLTNEVISIIKDTLALGDRADSFDASTKLLGAIPEFDSMAVVSLITAMEDEYGCAFDDDEISADIFESVATLTQCLEGKIDA